MVTRAEEAMAPMIPTAQLELSWWEKAAYMYHVYCTITTIRCLAVSKCCRGYSFSFVCKHHTLAYSSDISNSVLNLASAWYCSFSGVLTCRLPCSCCCTVRLYLSLLALSCSWCTSSDICWSVSLSPALQLLFTSLGAFNGLLVSSSPTFQSLLSYLRCLV